MRTILVGIRVTDLGRSLEFYSALGYVAIGRVPLDGGASLAVLRFPGEAIARLELVHRPADGPVEIGAGLDHLAIQVDELAPTLDRITAAGLTPGPMERPGGPDGPAVAWLTDPDGHRIELVQWPAGHAEGFTAADF